MTCEYCKSEVLFLKQADNKTGVYCKNCGRWLKWIDAAEKATVEQLIERQKREVIIDGKNIELVFENYKNYKAKHKAFNEELQFFKESKGNNNNQMIINSIYDKALKLKELSAKIAAYDEIFMALHLKRSL